MVARRRWSKPAFVISGSGLALACAAMLALEFVGPVPLIWALPVLGIAVGLIAGAAAFWSLHADLEQHTPALAMSSAGFAVLTLVAALVAVISGVGAVTRGELPAGIAVGGRFWPCSDSWSLRCWSPWQRGGARLCHAGRRSR